MSVYEIDNNNFEQILIASNEVNKMLIIKAYATWCKPCKAITVPYENLATIYKNFVFSALDVEECQDISSALKISCMPTFVILKNRNIVKRIEGANLSELKTFLDSNN
jgi:thioredoxin 1